VQALLSALTKEPKTSLTSENILGTLQKLSLRYLGRIIWYCTNLGQNNHYKNIAAIAHPNISSTSWCFCFLLDIINNLLLSLIPCCYITDMFLKYQCWIPECLGLLKNMPKHKGELSFEFFWFVNHWKSSPLHSHCFIAKFHSQVS